MGLNTAQNNQVIGPTGATGATGPAGPVNPAGSRSFALINPTASAGGPIWRTPVAITITGVHVLCVDGTNIVGQLFKYDANGGSGTAVDSTDITGTAGTTVNDDGTLSSPSISAGTYVGWGTTSVSGAVSKVIITFDYTQP